MLILLVDDDPEEFELFCEALKTMGSDIKCLHAHDGAEALRMLTERRPLPNYIFLDINMPVMNGWECLTQIKSDPRLASIPVLVYSTTSNAREIESYRQLGAAEFIAKPASFTQLVNVIRRTVT